MKIDIDALSEHELIELNHRIIERLKFIESLRNHHEMLKFGVGERVTFEPPGRGRLVGILVKYNKKSVTIITEDGHKWNVSPHLIGKAKDFKPTRQKDHKGNILAFNGNKK